MLFFNKKLETNCTNDNMIYTINEKYMKYIQLNINIKYIKLKLN